jgi:hypothetical protein
MKRQEEEKNLRILLKKEKDIQKALEIQEKLRI